ncbi:MAG: hypothetical protein AAGJ57_11395, partial [Pseudomonadota bacterium]
EQAQWVGNDTFTMNSPSLMIMPSCRPSGVRKWKSAVHRKCVISHPLSLFSWVDLTPYPHQ